MKAKICLLAVILCFIATFAAWAGSVNLPQTGQTQCRDANGKSVTCAGTGQDGAFQAGVPWPNPRFTDNGDKTITDKLTGLIFAKNAGTPKFGRCTGGAMPWEDAFDYVACLNTANYLGHKDWRLPNVNELASLINSGQSKPRLWLAKQGYTHVQQDFYWSSTTYAKDDMHAWSTHPDDADLLNVRKDHLGYAWPVRGGRVGNLVNSAIWATGQTESYHGGDDGQIRAGTAWPNPRFIDNNDGTVVDNLTGLMWTKNANLAGATKTWQQALDYVVQMNKGKGTYGHTDWRLPNWKELRSLVDYSQYDNALPKINPYINVKPEHYWSSSTFAKAPSYALFVDIADGYGMCGFVGGKTSNYYVWPVRAGLIVEKK